MGGAACGNGTLNLLMFMMYVLIRCSQMPCKGYGLLANRYRRKLRLSGGFSVVNMVPHHANDLTDHSSERKHTSIAYSLTYAARAMDFKGLACKGR